VDNRGVEAVASAAGIKVHDIDTLAGVPSAGGAPGSGPGPGTASKGAYFAYMEHNLGVLSGALGCNAAEQ
jgi:hypothetical protein